MAKLVIKYFLGFPYTISHLCQYISLFLELILSFTLTLRRNFTVTGHKTLWIPTKKKSMKSNKDRSLPGRKRPTANKVYRYHHQKITPGTTTLKYWHHFYEDEEAWPKVVLIFSSTERTTTAKPQTKTFANYFPSLYKPIPEDSADPEDRNNSNDSTEDDREESRVEDREEDRDEERDDERGNERENERGNEREEEQDDAEQIEEESTTTTMDVVSEDNTKEEDNYKETEDIDNSSAIFRREEDRATMGNTITATTTTKFRTTRTYTLRTTTVRTTTTKSTTTKTTTTEAPTSTKPTTTTRVTRTKQKTTVDTATYETYGDDITSVPTTTLKMTGEPDDGETSNENEGDETTRKKGGQETTRRKEGPETTRGKGERETTTRGRQTGQRPTTGVPMYTSTARTTPSRPLEIRCFQCGLNTSEIPYAPSCHHVFDTPDRTFHAQRRFYKVNCKNDEDEDRVLKSNPVGDINDYYVTPPDKTYRGKPVTNNLLPCSSLCSKLVVLNVSHGRVTSQVQILI